MKPIVIDSSFFLRSLVIFNVDYALYFEQIKEWEKSKIKLYAPTLWHYEVTSTITKNLRFKTITVEQADHAFVLLSKFKVQLVRPNPKLTATAYAWTRKLQRASAYDSFYLALAQALDTDFWTADKKLYNAVGTDWIHMLES